MNQTTDFIWVLAVFPLLSFFSVPGFNLGYCIALSGLLLLYIFLQIMQVLGACSHGWHAHHPALGAPLMPPKAVVLGARRSDGCEVSSFGERCYWAWHICWPASAQTLHFVTLAILQPDTPTVTVGFVTFARLMCLVYRKQKARLVWDKNVVFLVFVFFFFLSPVKQRSKNIE